MNCASERGAATGGGAWAVAVCHIDEHRLFRIILPKQLHTTRLVQTEIAPSGRQQASSRRRYRTEGVHELTQSLPEEAGEGERDRNIHIDLEYLDDAVNTVRCRQKVGKHAGFEHAGVCDVFRKARKRVLVEMPGEEVEGFGLVGSVGLWIRRRRDGDGGGRARVGTCLRCDGGARTGLQFESVSKSSKARHTLRLITGAGKGASITGFSASSGVHEESRVRVLFRAGSSACLSSQRSSGHRRKACGPDHLATVILHVAFQA